MPVPAADRGVGPGDALTRYLAELRRVTRRGGRLVLGGVAFADAAAAAVAGDAALAPGLNPLAIVATDQAGHARKANRSILAASYLAPGAHNPHGAAMVLTDAIVAAIEQVTAHGPRTRDMGGDASTAEVGRAVAQALERLP